MTTKNLLLFLLFLTTNAPLCALSTTIKHAKKTGSGIALLVKFNLQPHEFILKDSLRFSTDAPHIVTSPWKTKQKAQSHYMSGTKNNKEIYTEPLLETWHRERTKASRRPVDHRHKSGIHFCGICSKRTCFHVGVAEW